jgi:hypothetical protein
MKKVIIMLAMVLAMNVVANAANGDESKTQIENVEMYKFNINHEKLKKTLECDKEQADFVDYAVEEFENDMLFASTVSDSTSRDKVVRNAIKKNLNLMGMTLDKRQFRKYLTLINISLTNRGFIIY